MNPTNPTTIGILSDTHGLLRPEVEQALSGCQYILHAGDVGDEQVLARLGRIAPVIAVRGNMDHDLWAHSLPINEMVELEGIFFYILHDLYQLDLEPSAAGIDVVVSGHTHQPKIFKKNGVTYLNPGSAGHRRFNYPVSIARVRIENGATTSRIVEIGSVITS